MKTNPRKTTTMRYLGEVDMLALAQAVAEIPDAVWSAENDRKPNKFEALDKTQHIVFRFVKTTDDHKVAYDMPLWAVWSSRLTPVLEQVAHSYGYEQAVYPRVMLAKMDPGGVIHPHVDAGPAAGFPHKIHVPLQTNPQVKFFIDPNYYHFEVGKAYEVNNRVMHAVKNEGSTSRIHLIFECYDPEQSDMF